MADIDFYDIPENRGSYQYIPLSDFVINFMALRGHDSYVSMVDRDRVIINAKRGIKEFSYDILRELKVIELDLTDKLTVVLPHDYVNYVRISWVDEKGELRPFSINKKLNTSIGYLQDNTGDILFDNNGYVLKSTGTRYLSGQKTENPSYLDIYCMSFTPNFDQSEVDTKGTYNIDKVNGVIQFSSNAKGRTIVLEYISDGLSVEGGSSLEPRINKMAESALMDFVYYELIKGNVNVPMNEKIRARREYYSSKKRAKRRINTLRKDDLLKSFKKVNKWIKS